MVDFVLKFLENSDRILRTCFRNANQCYPVTRKFFGLGKFSDKVMKKDACKICLKSDHKNVENSVIHEN